MVDEPLRFLTDLKPLQVMERQTAVFELRLSKKTDSPLVWQFKDKELKRDEKFDVCVSDDGLTYTLKIKDVRPSDTGDYTINIGDLTTTTSLFIERKRLKNGFQLQTFLFLKLYNVMLMIIFLTYDAILLKVFHLWEFAMIAMSLELSKHSTSKVSSENCN